MVSPYVFWRKPCTSSLTQTCYLRRASYCCCLMATAAAWWQKCKRKLTADWAGGLRGGSCTQTTFGAGGAATAGSFLGLPTGLGGGGGGWAAVAPACCFSCSSTRPAMSGSKRMRSSLGCSSLKRFRFVQPTSNSVLWPFGAYGRPRGEPGSKPGCYASSW